MTLLTHREDEMTGKVFVTSEGHTGVNAPTTLVFLLVLQQRPEFNEYRNTLESEIPSATFYT